MKNFRLLHDPARVAYEDVAGEIIAIDFRSGAYFSLRNSAAEIWRYLLAGAAPEAVEAAAASATSEGASSVSRFIEEMIQADLLVRSEAPAEPVPVHFATFEPPMLEKFEDMAELIQLDPIHEVSQEGWPHRATADD